MSEFTGMALYSQSDIESALANYLDYSTEIIKGMNAAIAAAESKYRPSWLARLCRKNTLRDVCGKIMFVPYEQELASQGYISYDLYLRYNRLYELELVYNDIHDLYGSGRDCYLTPTQSKFVNKFKDM